MTYKELERSISRDARLAMYQYIEFLKNTKEVVLDGQEIEESLANSEMILIIKAEGKTFFATPTGVCEEMKAITGTLRTCPTCKGARYQMFLGNIAVCAQCKGMGKVIVKE